MLKEKSKTRQEKSLRHFVIQSKGMDLRERKESVWIVHHQIRKIVEARNKRLENSHKEETPLTRKKPTRKTHAEICTSIRRIRNCVNRNRGKIRYPFNHS